MFSLEASADYLDYSVSVLVFVSFCLCLSFFSPCLFFFSLLGVNNLHLYGLKIGYFVGPEASP